MHILRITIVPADADYDEEVEYEVVHPDDCPTETYECSSCAFFGEPCADPTQHKVTDYTCGVAWEVNGCGLDGLAFDPRDFPDYDDSRVSNQFGLDAWRGLPEGDYEIESWCEYDSLHGEYDGGLTLVRSLAAQVDPT